MLASAGGALAIFLSGELVSAGAALAIILSGVLASARCALAAIFRHNPLPECLMVVRVASAYNIICLFSVLLLWTLVKQRSRLEQAGSAAGLSNFPAHL